MPHPGILAVGQALPPHYADQEQLIAAFRKLWARQHFNLDRLEQLHRSVRVSGRHLALPIDAYEGIRSFAEANRAWTECAVSLGADAIERALSAAGLRAADVDQIFFTTVTGIAAPSIDARLVNRLGLRPDVKRTPMFGLGCVAGAAGVARASDTLRGAPGEIALLVSVELCSLTLQREDLSIPNIIASGLFGDGAAAVVLGGADRVQHGPQVVATRSVFYPDTEWVMGWNVVESGFQVVLSAQVPNLVRERIRGDVDAFLAGHGLQRGDIAHWICHPGGPKVLEAFAESLEQPREAFARTWRSLEAVGNLSSASVLFVLGDTLAEAGAAPGDFGLLLAMGPGFCSELVLLRW